jgi:hypothetical protein
VPETDSIPLITLSMLRYCALQFIYCTTLQYTYSLARNRPTSINTGECQQVRIVRRLVAYCVQIYEANDGSVF